MNRSIDVRRALGLFALALLSREAGAQVQMWDFLKVVRFT